MEMKELSNLIKEVITSLDVKRFGPQLIKINDNYLWDKQGLVLYNKDHRVFNVKGKEVTLINIFCSGNINTVFSTDEILDLVWPEIEDKNKSVVSLRATLSMLKKKLGKKPLFQSVYNVGYKLVK